MSAPQVTTAGRLLLGVVEAEEVARALGHPAAGPLADLAETLRDGDGQAENERVAEALATWLGGA